VSNTPCPVVVLISGNGSNLQAMIDASARADCPYCIAGVVSNRADAFGLQRAEKAGIPVAVVDHTQHNSRESFDQALIQSIDRFRPALLVLAGFMRILTPGFVQHYHGRILNIHPSLLPDYRGTNTHQRVLDAGETRHGVSVHFVTEELDGGPVIRQAVIPVEPGDTRDTLARKVAAREHNIYPEVVHWFAEGRLEMRADSAWLDGKKLPAQGLRTD